jgi:membrane protein required for colicin V production
MHWLDFSLLALLAVGAGLGYWSGLLMQVARLLCFAVAVCATLLFNEPVTQFLHDHVIRDAHINLLRGISYVLVFLATYIALFALSRLLYKVVRETKLEFLDRLAGAALGAIKMILILAPVCALLAYLSLPTTDEWLNRSTIAPVLARGVNIAVVLVPEKYKNQAQESVDDLRDRLQHEAVDRAFDLQHIEDALKKK